MIIKNLNKSYPIKNNAPVQAVKNLSLDLPERGIIFIVGKSGSGKTTLLHLLSGLEKADGGEIFFRGKDVLKLSPDELDHYRNSYCGIIFQEYNLIPELNVSENISLALEMKGEKETQSTVRDALARVGLKGYEARRLNELSGGQRQRVAIARALVKNPQIVFADEPIGALDSVTGKEILQLLKEISSDALVLVVTHDRDFAEEFGDAVVELADGEIVKNEIRQETVRDADGFSMTPSRLSLRSAFKIGVSNFKFHPVRLLVAILLSVISFTFFCVPLDASMWNFQKGFVDEVYRAEVGYSVISKLQLTGHEYGAGDESLDRFLGADDSQYRGVPLSESDFLRFDELTGGSAVRIEDGQDAALFYDEIYGLKNIDPALTKQLWDEWLAYYATCDEYATIYPEDCVYMREDQLARYGYTLTGRLPQNVDEVAIPKSIYNFVSFFGLKGGEGEKISIERQEDLLGVKINISHSTFEPHYLTVVGVVDEHCMKECGEKHIEERTKGDGVCIHGRMYVDKSFLSKYAYIYYPTPQNKTEFSAVVKYIAEYSEGENVSYHLSNAASHVYTAAQGGIVTMISRLCLYIGIVFFLFAMITLFQFIKVSIQNQRKQIGILSAMGLNTRGIMKIYATVTTVICMIVFALSIVAIGFAGMGANAYFSEELSATVRICTFHWCVPIVLFASLALVAFLGCMLPVLQYKRKTSAENIRKGMIG